MIITEKYKLLFKPEWFLGTDRINKMLDIIGFSHLSNEDMKELIKEVRIKVEIDTIKRG